MPGVADRGAWSGVAAGWILVLSACSPVDPPLPEVERLETSAGPEAARAQAGVPDAGEPGSLVRFDSAPPPAGLDSLQAGDIIFHVSRSAQSKAIQLATRSPYSHIGIVESGADGWVVLEAVEPVKRTPIGEWIARGVDGRFVVKRLKDASERLTPDAAIRLRTAGARFIGKHYDAAFGWSDDRIYCSELVYKVYHEVFNIEVGPIQRLREFDLGNPVVKRKLVERYGQRIPLDEPVVSPAGIFDSPTLTTVLER